MVYRILADALVLLHLAFILFVLFGGFLVLWRRWVLWFHLAAAAWGAIIEFTGWICPLTPWEQALRIEASQVGYGGGFIEHYLEALIYPADLTPRIQMSFGLIVVFLNIGIYAYIGLRRRRLQFRS